MLGFRKSGHKQSINTGWEGVKHPIYSRISDLGGDYEGYDDIKSYTEEIACVVYQGAKDLEFRAYQL